MDLISSRINLAKEYLQTHPATRRLAVFLLTLLLVGAFLISLLLGAAYYLASAYREQIPVWVNQFAREKLCGEVRFSNYSLTVLRSFPDIQLSLENTVVRDTLFNTGSPPLLKAGYLSARFRFWNLLNSQIRINTLVIRDADLFLLRKTDGYFNAHFLKKDSTSSSGNQRSGFTARRILIRDLRFSMIDSSRQKYYRFVIRQSQVRLRQRGGKWKMDLNGNWHFNGLTFKPEQGGFLSGREAKMDLNIEWRPSRQQLAMLPSRMTIEGISYHLKGMLMLGQPHHLSLSVAAPKVPLARARRLLAPKIQKELASFKLDRPLRMDFQLSGLLIPGRPQRIRIQFDVENANFSGPSWAFSRTSFHGRFSNACDSTGLATPNSSCLHLAPFRAEVFGAVPLQATIAIKDLKDPHLGLEGRVEMPLVRFNSLLPPDKMQFKGGILHLDFSHYGKFGDLNQSGNPWKKGRLKGRLTIDQGAVDYLPRGLEVRRLTGDCSFNESDFLLDTFSLELNRNPLQIKGNIRELAAFVIHPGNQIDARLDIYTQTLNFNHFPRPKAIPQKVTAPGGQSQIAVIIDAILNNMEADITLRAPIVRYRKFEATDARGNVVLSSNQVILRNIDMSMASGRFTLDGRISGLQTPQPLIDVRATIRNVDIQQYFRAFENFRQQALTAENIKGRLWADIKFQAATNARYDILPASMNARLDLQVSRGELLNVSGLMNLNNFLFKNRDMSHIQFDTIINTFHLSGPRLQIEHMNVRSNALVLDMEGTYGFRGGIDLLIGLPVRNLFKKEFTPEALSSIKAGGAGMRILLRASDESGEMRIRPVLFGKKRGKRN